MWWFFLCCVFVCSRTASGSLAEEMSETTQLCCNRGTFYARNHTSEDGASSVPPDLPTVFSSLCIFAMNQCRLEYFQKKYDCESGIELASSTKSCVLSNDSSKKCCKECLKGASAGAGGNADVCANRTQGTSAEQLLAGDAFSQCCQKAMKRSSGTETSSQRPGNGIVTRRPLEDDLTSECDMFAPTELCAHHCIPIPGSYRCECNPGFMLMVDGRNCMEVTTNRCKPHNPCQHKCNDNGIAVKCSCRRGYQLKSDEKSCEDIDECKIDTPVCLPNAQCFNVLGSYKCIPTKKQNHVEKGQCPPGFARNVLNNACDDINECTLPSPPCPSYLCENTVGAYKCGGITGDPVNLGKRAMHSFTEDPCPPGFKSGGNEECEDVDECAAHKDDCNAISQFCINTKGSFYCQDKVSKHCPPGFKIDPDTNKCEDINECEEEEGICKSNQICVNLPGEYNCRPNSDRNSSINTNRKCADGLRYNSKYLRCVDIDECVEGTHICDQYQTCLNTFGSHECNCKPGFELDSTTGACVDINECATDQNDCIAESQRCDNTVGSYLCIRFISCGTGYILHHSSSKCEDIDECALGTHNCARAGPEYQCHNILGSFRCIKRKVSTTSTTTALPEYEDVYYDSEDDIVDNTTNEVMSENKSQIFPESATTTTPKSTITTEASRPLTIPESYVPPVTTSPVIITEKAVDIPTERTANDNDKNKDIYSIYNNQPKTIYLETTPLSVVYNVSTHRENERTEIDNNIDYSPTDSIKSSNPEVHTISSEISNSTESDQYEISYIPDGSKQRESTEQSGPKYDLDPGNQVPLETPRPTIVESNQTPQPETNETNVYKSVTKTEIIPSTTPNVVDIDVSKENATAQEQQTPDGSVFVDNKAVPKNEWNTITKPVECQIGFEMDAYGACFDIDECVTNRHSCSGLTELCRNTMGGYLCDCAEGFRRDFKSGACAFIIKSTTSTTTTSTTTPPPPPPPPPSTTERSYFWGYPDQRAFTTRKFKPTNICDVGFHYNSKTSTCEDIDECTNGQANCAAVEICVNTQGGYRCECPPNWKLDEVRHRCVPLRNNELFPTGYGNEQTYPTADPNEIVSYRNKGNEVVTPFGTIQDENRGTVMKCPWGYRRGDDNSCQDVDECLNGEAKCGFMQLCTNLPGGYTCSCPRGYKLVGDHECEDIDECTVAGAIPVCSQNADCVNTLGSYLCRCHNGFRPAPVNEKVCVDVDECIENRAGTLCQQRCNNVWGGYRCSCHRGYRINSDNSTCSDVDECTEFKSKNLCIGRCMNEPGSYRCSCPSGYRLSEDKRSCIDIDECETGEAPCSNGGTFGGTSDVCVNTRGGYRCHRITCSPGYQLENRHRCTKIESICSPSDWECAHQPSTYSYNFITFVSKLYIPASKVDLFTMRGPAWPYAKMRFELRLIQINAPPTVKERADINAFLLVQKGNQGVVSLMKSLEGPQSIEIELSMELYNREQFGGIAVAKLYLYVSEYEF